MTDTVTLEEVQDIAQSVRESLESVHGQCYPASKTLCEELVSQTPAESESVEIEEVRVGKRGTIRHYVVAYPAKLVSDSDADGRILIDVTLDQYCTEFEEAGRVKTSLGPRDSIPDVNIYESKGAAPYR